MKVAIYQPRFFPQLHYFNRMFESDTFVLLDDAQYTKSLVHESGGVRQRFKSFQSDTPIISSSGMQMLTVPILHGEHQPLNQKQIDYSQKWVEQSLRILRSTYAKAPFFEKYYPQVQKILKERFVSLAALNVRTTLWGVNILLNLSLPYEKLQTGEINTYLARSPYRLKRILLSRDLGVSRPEGNSKGMEWTVEICKALSATEYLHGGTATTAYMDLNYYKEAGITTVEQQWTCKEYAQPLALSGFLPNLSILDLLFSVDLETARRIVFPVTPSIHEKKGSTYAWV